MVDVPSPAPSPDASHGVPIAFGIAGWSYPDWTGYVYPPGTKDTLRYVARYVDMIEINSTFYRPPDTRTVQSWVRRTEDLPGFFFTAKLHQDVTHKGRVDPAMSDAFHAGFDPMLAAGTLRHLLAQFPWYFSDSAESRDRLLHIRRTYGDMTNLTLELRHNSWQAPAAMEFLQALGVTVAHLDYPLAKTSFNLAVCAVGTQAYLRLHGRNAKAWFSKDAGRDETYNYRYDAAELGQIADRVITIARMSKTLAVVANNHYQGKEAVNILELKARLTGRPVALPPPLAARYPDLLENPLLRPE